MEQLQNYVEGQWKDGEGRLRPLHDPTVGEVIAECGTGGIDMAAAVAYARDVGGPKLREMTFADRGALLQAASKALYAHREELIEHALRNSGNTRKDAKFDIDGATGTLAAYGYFAKELGETRVVYDGDGTQLGRTARFWGQHVLVPRRGVAVHINAFNFPAWGFAEKAAVAWLAGVPVICKPATATSLLTERMVRILADEQILPDGALSLLCGSAGDLLDHLGSQDHLAFTGSADTGLLLRSKENLLRSSVRVNVEADSLNGAVLGPDVEPGSETWNVFLRDLVIDMTQKVGQKCTAIRRVFVPAGKIDTIQEELCARLADTKIGNPDSSEVTIGPLATADQLADARAGVEKLTAEADIVFGSVETPELVGCDGDAGYFFGPVLLRSKDTAASTVVHEHEVFGPVATLLPWDGDAEEVCELVRRGDGGLVCSVYSNDRDFLAEMVLGIGSHHGRLYLGSDKMAGQALGPGTVLPASIHGGPGRAGGGEELGGLRGLAFYMQRVALQGDRGIVDRLFPKP